MKRQRLVYLSVITAFFLFLVIPSHSIHDDPISPNLTDNIVIISEPSLSAYNQNYAHIQGVCGVSMLCQNASCSKLAWQGAGPEIVYSPAGSSSSFDLETLRINSPLHITFRNDNYFTGMRLALNRTKEAISLAAQTWSYDANQNMFYYDVTTDPNATVGNGNCLIQFSPSVSGLGITTIWTDGSGRVMQANMLLSTAYTWTTDYITANTSNVIDLQSVVLHELGHITGLGDLYNLPSNDSRRTDYNEIMNLYRGRHPQHSTGKGDRAGLQSIYGCGTVPTTTSTTTTTTRATTTTSTTSTTTSTTSTTTSSTTTTYYVTTTTSTTTTTHTTSTTSTTSSTSTTSILSSTTTIPSTTTTIPVNATTTTIPGNTTTSTTTTSIITTTTIPANTNTTTTSTSTTTTIRACPLVGDYPPCGEISLSEVVDLINMWAADKASLGDTIALITKWATT